MHDRCSLSPLSCLRIPLLSMRQSTNALLKLFPDRRGVVDFRKITQRRQARAVLERVYAAIAKYKLNHARMQAAERVRLSIACVTSAGVKLSSLYWLVNLPIQPGITP